MMSLRVPVSYWRKESDLELDPDPLVRGTDPWIRIQIYTKMSQIPNTDLDSILTSQRSPKSYSLHLLIKTQSHKLLFFFGGGEGGSF